MNSLAKNKDKKSCKLTNPEKKSFSNIKERMGKMIFSTLPKAGLRLDSVAPE
ncbi:MAG: hypothetical protein K0B09_00080 [Bacteroidales bacterium]|nr:hypothetical protein [Bacteroidales bacterium]